MKISRCENKQNRIITAYGPTQLLNVISVLETITIKKSKYRDFLIIPHLMTQDKKTELLLLNITKKLARLWPFKKIIYYRDIKDSVFEENKKLFVSKIKIKNVKEIFVCRNWQMFHEIVLAAFKESKIVCYGDGIGGGIELNGFGAAKHWQKMPFNPQGFKKIDEANLFFPFEDEPTKTTFSQIRKFKILPKNKLIKTIRKASKLLKIIKYKNPKNSILVLLPSSIPYSLCFSKNLLKNLIKIGEIFSNQSYLKKIYQKWIDDKEINFLKDHFITYFKKTDKLILKSHPRSRLNKNSIEKIAKANNFHVEVLSDYQNCIPAELYIFQNRFKLVHTLFSSTVYGASLLKAPFFAGTNSDIQKKYFTKTFVSNWEKYKKFLLAGAKNIQSKKTTKLRLGNFI